MTIELHPLCTLFPRMSGGKFSALVEDIRANGLRTPITLHDGLILDGGNRYRACIEAGIEPTFAKFDGASLVGFVLSANLHRRHMTAGQQAAIVASAQDWAKAQTHGGSRKADQVDACPLETIAGRAAASGVSTKTQQRADKVAKSDPDLARAVGHGDVPLSAAVAQVEGRPKPPKPPKPQEPEEPEYTALDAANDQIADLQDALALATAGDLTPEDKDQVAVLIASLREEVKTLTACLRAVTASRDHYQAENGELKQQIRLQRREIDKITGQKTA